MFVYRHRLCLVQYGINAATIANGNKTVKVYNLQGRLVATTKSLNDLHLASGVYIVNNKKVIVK